jgi:hypothetical protein
MPLDMRHRCGGRPPTLRYVDPFPATVYAGPWREVRATHASDPTAPEY